MDVEEKVEELASRVDKLEKENRELKERNRKLEKSMGENRNSSEENNSSSNDISRRKFMKMLGLGAGGLALSSSAAGAWSLIQPQNSGTSDIQAETATAAAGNFDLQGNSLTDTTQGFLDLAGGSNDLRIGTGQAIEDGSGNGRLKLWSGATGLYGQNGNSLPRIKVEESDSIQLDPTSDTPVVVRDHEGGFDALKYITSSSDPGRLELTNTVLDASSNDIYFPNSDGNGIIKSTGNLNTFVLETDGGGNSTVLSIESPDNGQLAKLFDGSVGTLELTNSDLDISSNTVQTQNGFSSPASQTETNVSPDTWVPIDDTRVRGIYLVFIRGSDNDDPVGLFAFTDDSQAYGGSTTSILNESGYDGEKLEVRYPPSDTSSGKPEFRYTGGDTTSIDFEILIIGQ